jgi:hypothetical protein
MNTPQKLDTESFAKLVLFQLASLRAESIQTQRKVLEILEHQQNSTLAQYKSLVMDQEKQKIAERDRIFREMLKMAGMDSSAMPSGIDSPLQNGTGHFQN